MSEISQGMDTPLISGALTHLPQSIVETRFASLTDLHLVHDQLLEQLDVQEESGDTSTTFWNEVAEFLQQAQNTGAIFDLIRERRIAQSILDYWGNALYRANRAVPPLRLVAFDPELAPELPDEPIPYQGLAAFSQEKHEFFFGRERIIQTMIEQLQAGERLLMVVGASGSGKSSTVLAGLLPALVQVTLAGSNQWHKVILTPGSQPVANLTHALSATNSTPAVQAITSDQTATLVGLANLATTQRTILVIDQFEEIFTLCDDQKARQRFVEQFLELTTNNDPQHVVVLTMRTDFVDNIARLPELWQHFRVGHIDLDALDINELRAAIEQPAAKVGLRFAEGIVDDLISTILGERAGLPLLQFTLLKLWQQRQRNRITQDVYQQVGNPRQALERSAEALYTSLIPEEQQTMRRILLRLVRPGEGSTEFTSNRLRVAEIFQRGEARDRIARVLARLVNDERLLKISGGNQYTTVTFTGEIAPDLQIEVAHEALVRNWPRLANWLDEDREQLRQRLRLLQAANEWETQGRDTNLLWRGTLLASTAAYDDLNELELLFVQISRDAEATAARAEQEAQRRELDLAHAQQMAVAERRRVRQARLALVGLSVLLVFMLATVAWALSERQDAEDARRVAETAGTVAQRESERALARERDAQDARAVADSNAQAAERQALVAKEERKRADERAAEAERQTRRATADNIAVQAQVLVQREKNAGDQALILARNAVLATLTTDGYVTVNADAALRTAINSVAWRMTIPSANERHYGAVHSATFSADGQVIASAGADGTIRLWQFDPASAKLAPLKMLTGHTGLVRSVAFSPDGRTIVSSGDDNTIRIWDRTIGQLQLTLRGHSGPVTSVVFSPDGHSILSTSTDTTLRLWDPSSGVELRNFLGHSQAVRTAQFSPDGKSIVSASGDDTVRLWDTTTGAELAIYKGHTDSVTAAAFSPDGKLVVSSGEDFTIRLWDVATSTEKIQLQGHTDSIFDVALSPDGNLIASASDDNTIRLWDTVTGEEVKRFSGHTDSVYSVQFSPDGQLILSTGEDGTIRLWDVATGAELPSTDAHKGLVRSAIFSPDGQMIVSAGIDGTIRLWNASDGAAIAVFKGHTEGVNSVAFSTDGKKLRNEP